MFSVADKKHDDLVREKENKGYTITSRNTDLWENYKKELIKDAAELCLDGRLDSPQYKSLVALLDSNDEENRNLAKEIINAKQLV